MKPGIYDGMSAAWYHEQPGLSNSFLREFSRSPAYAITPKERTPQKQKMLDKGAAGHTMILEPDKTNDRIIRMLQGMTRKQRVGKALAKIAKKEKKILLSHDEWEQIKGMANAIRGHPQAARLLKNAAVERSLFWDHPLYGFPCKARLDIDQEGKDIRIITDLKSTSDARPDPFSRIYFNLKYYWQAYWYLEGARIVLGPKELELFVCIAVETEKPHGVWPYKTDPEDLTVARYQVPTLVDHYAECLETNQWPCYPMVDSTISMPGWARKRGYNAIFD